MTVEYRVQQLEVGVEFKGWHSQNYEGDSSTTRVQMTVIPPEGVESWLPTEARVIVVKVRRHLQQLILADLTARGAQIPPREASAIKEYDLIVSSITRKPETPVGSE